jgi:hypothetical protein
MKKIISLFLITFLVMSLSQGITRGVTQASVTQFSVTVNPAYRGDMAEYKITFITGADLTGGLIIYISSFRPKQIFRARLAHTDAAHPAFKLMGIMPLEQGSLAPKQKQYILQCLEELQ